ncbi:NnrU family protein [Candidatus Methylocalor cossyra]|uniref:NnrU domain-containing protein n=1 Tax=Candidatus Methylocalor cossyra TaxID=3108543 RepID=A0ABM9NKF4_9GAMM
MLQLLLAALFFTGIHVVVSGTRLRDALLARFGERAFRAGFSLLSLFGLGWLVQAYRGAPYIETWGQLIWFKPVAVALMLPAFLLAVIGLTTPGPTAVGGEGQLQREEPARGILRVTRHPFLWGVALWALLHLIGNGDLAALVLFGSFLVLVLVGTRSIDAKRRWAWGEHWERFAAVTSNLPFVAIGQGRNVWKPREIGGWRPALAVLLYLLVLHFHARWFGVSPWP